MRIIDALGNEITAPNLENGRLIEEQIVKVHHAATEAIEEVFHYVTVAEYPNGGKDIEKVIDIPGVPAREAWDEYETVQRYVEFSAAEKIRSQIAALKQKLAQTDYITAKAVDAMTSADSLTALLAALKNIRTEYADVLAQRAAWRKEINELEGKGDEK